MKRLITTLFACAAFCASGFAVAQEEQPVPEQLKQFGPMLGTWVHEGPLMEDLEGIAKQGTPYKFQISWRRILDKSVVMVDWSIEIEGGKKVSGKGLFGWNAADSQLAYGGMNSMGGMNLGTVEFDKQAKTSTLTAKGVDAEGNETSIKTVVTKTGKDTLTWQALERSGGIAQGESPVVTFKRVPRAKKAAAGGPQPVMRPKTGSQAPPIK